MLSNQSICEACQHRAVDVIETTDDPVQPYRLCASCHERLMDYALRPIEWYNLASVHGSFKPMLHDDLYDEDGTACQPETEVIVTRQDLPPSLEQAQSDVEALLSFAVTRWYVEDEVISALKQHDALELLDALKTRYEQTPNLDVKARLLEIVADVIQTPAADWVRSLWHDVDVELLDSLASATATSLPTEEGLKRVYDKLDAIEPKELPSVAFLCLYRFRSPDVLDWIESNCDAFDSNWARLAAVSMPTWHRMNAWLERGRPFSLVALEAMVSCVEGHGGLYVDTQSPRILETHLDEIEPVLTAYERNDSVPRVRRQVAILLQNKDDIFT
ncbi:MULTISPECIES: hypothetical protein [Exiguobacterium]|uniref:hypothetical protein n=1 Tax=Exiguobacterium TaxID=33986 RepID=UPI0004A94B37|nr:hypothetical protein [Exiguobacterium sp. AB2]KDN59190.1 hypothetical protein DI14_02065 [Exiguobacterium sp. AB2]